VTGGPLSVALATYPIFPGSPGSSKRKATAFDGLHAAGRQGGSKPPFPGRHQEGFERPGHEQHVSRLTRTQKNN